LTEVVPVWRWGRGGMVGCDMFAVLLRVDGCGDLEGEGATAVCVSVSVRDFAIFGKRLVVPWCGNGGEE
jgi:hypothetical protein